MIIKLKVNDSFLVLYFTKASYRILPDFHNLLYIEVVVGGFLYILLSVENAASG